jgi:uncharacterized protein YndB with AHSA1/START domain
VEGDRLTMGNAADTPLIRRRLHLTSPPERVFELLATDAGRARFWAESAAERDGALDFVFPNGLTWRGRILANDPPRRYTVEYFGDSTTTFELEPDGAGGTDLTLTDTGVPEADLPETTAGWVSVLMSLKAAVDHGVDLRNHDPARSWDQGFADN